jgi:hypothetical protein
MQKIILFHVRKTARTLFLRREHFVIKKRDNKVEEKSYKGKPSKQRKINNDKARNKQPIHLVGG